MSLSVKICGLRDRACVDAAVAGGAHFLGFVFAPSRRRIAAEDAKSLIAGIPPSISSVGLFVDPSDAEIDKVLNICSLGMLQLHGNEPPARVAEIRRRTGLPVIKAAGISSLDDIVRAGSYCSVADYLLLDAKPADPAAAGGHGVAFDWGLLKNAAFSIPWFLAGGLNASNIETAVLKTGAKFLDVSSGVENAAGQKTPYNIKAFLVQARKIETCC